MGLAFFNVRRRAADKAARVPDPVKKPEPEKVEPEEVKPAEVAPEAPKAKKSKKAK